MKHLRKICVNLLIINLCLMAQTAISQSWTNLGNGMSQWINALAISPNGELYAGGVFTNAGGVSASKVAKWNGTTWTNLSSGISGTVYALTADTNGELFAGGYFTTAGGVAAYGVAKWNGSNWTNLGSGINLTVDTLAIGTNGELYAGGDFTNAGGVSANYIAKWNGSNWTNLGGGMNHIVKDLVIGPNGELFAGGVFTTAGGMSANRIAKWNGSNWTNLDGGVDDTVFALAADTNGELYAGGYFTTAGGVSANRIAKWNGSNWTNLSSGMNLGVYTLVIGPNGELYAGGVFTNAGGVSANRIAKWNGSNWTNLDSGMNGYVDALAIGINGELYAGGDFTNAGGISANYIAKWATTNATNDVLPAPQNVAASDGLYADRVALTWGAVSNATGYTVWRSGTNDTNNASFLAGGIVTTNYNDTGVVVNVTNYYWVKATNTSGVSAFSSPDAGWRSNISVVAVGPTIKANGATNNITVNYPDTVSITVEMNADIYEGINVDWWVVASANYASWFYMDSALEWAEALFSGNYTVFHPVYQGPLINLPSTTVLPAITLPPGTYYFWFAVDYPMDGILNPNGPILYDQVTVTVQ